MNHVRSAITVSIAALIGCAPTNSLAQNQADYIYDVHGRLKTALRSDGSATYTYDGAGNRTRLITKVGANHAPVAVNLNASAFAGGSTIRITVLQSLSDQDGDPLSLSVAPLPANQGSASIAPDQLSIYYSASTAVASGSYTVHYTISDGISSSSADVTIVVTNEASPPSSGDEIIPVAFTASSAYNGYGYTGLTTQNGMRDGQFSAANTTYATEYESNTWIKADLGSVKTVNSVKLAPADAAAPGGLGPGYLSGTLVQISADNATWTPKVVAAYVPAGTYNTLDLGGVSARYIRLFRSYGNIGIGDFRVFGASSGGGGNPQCLQAPTVANVSTSIDYHSQNNAIPLSVSGCSATSINLGQATHGSTSIAGATASYTHADNYSGQDSFTYTASNAYGVSSPATVTVTIRPPTPQVNRAPIAGTDYVTIPNGAPTVIRVLDNDYDLDGDPLTITATRTVTGALSSVNNDGTVTYSPTSGYDGPDTLSYDLSDGHGGTATGSVILNVSRRNDPPIAVDQIVDVNQSTTTTLLPLANDSDPGDTFLLNWVGPLQFVYGNLGTPTDLGSTTISGNSVIYSAPFVCNCAARAYYHVVRFQYEVVDSRGQTSRAWHAINVYSQPTAANQNPTTLPDTLFVTDGSTGYADVLTNDSDPDGDALSIIEVIPPAAAHAFYSIVGSSIQVDYASHGTDDVTYKVSDGHGGTATGTLHVNLN